MPQAFCLFLLLALPLAAQWDAMRHPLYDAACPTEEQAKVAPLATQLRLYEDADHRITAGDADCYARMSADAQSRVLSLHGWRGERVNTQLVIAADGAAPQLSVRCESLQGPEGASLTPELHMVRYTRAHGTPVADVIGKESCCDNPAGILRPIWVQVDIPRGARAGSYAGTLSVTAEGCAPVQLVLQVEVDEEMLPAPRDWQMHVDFWQHPDAVARWHDVAPWSAEHLALMRPLMQRLADCGQKVITCAIIDEAWSGQTYDWFPSQIRWIRGRDGEMRYDYSIFDTWVSFMQEQLGEGADIFCYTMVPWSMSICYFDEASGEEAQLALDHTQPSYELIWGHFLKNFRAHLREHGWLEKTSIALDERPDDLVRTTKNILAEYAPELRVISSVNAPSAESEDIYLVSPILQHADSLTPELVARRRAHGQKSIFYTCLSPKKPNSFTYSPPAESEWLGLFAAAQGLDGYSRWAYNSWNKNPFETTDFKHWPSGDCFLVYPGNLSSVRLERLRDGFEDYEKIRILRERAARTNSLAAQQAIEYLNRELKKLFSMERSQGNTHAEDVQAGRRLIDECARQMGICRDLLGTMY
ncbi:MAG: DUF4091 domain-containing protein [Akkermansia sp.]|nr:DUF4091 domain-containing protein [Akkermansia sp.]